MKSTVAMRTAKIGYITISLLLCVLGLAMFFAPEFSVPVIGKLIGIGMVTFGVIKMVGYFSRDLFRLAFQYDLAFGILTLALGIIVLCCPAEAIGFLCVMLGVPVLADGLFKVQIAIDARRFGIGQWWLILALAVLTGAAGLLLVLRPYESAQALTSLLGLSLFCDGVLNLGVAICTVKIVHYQGPDVIEGTGFVEKED